MSGFWLRVNDCTIQATTAREWWLDFRRSRPCEPILTCLGGQVWKLPCDDREHAYDLRAVLISIDGIPAAAVKVRRERRATPPPAERTQ